MRIGVPRETSEGERRVGLVPETVGKLSRQGFTVLVESGAGRDYNPDEAYREAGAEVVEGASEVYSGADLVIKVARPSEDEIEKMREGQVLVCFLNGPTFPETVERLARAGVTVFSNEAIPRTSVAQAMDALSSMGSIAGYKAAIIAADSLGRYIPMLSSAAGTTKAAKVMVFGVAVAGLQAIAIMNRLGAEVFAYDIRPETKDQARSLGATFLDSNDEREEENGHDEFVEYEPEGFAKLMAKLGFHSFAEPPRDKYIVEGEEEETKAAEEEGWSREKLGRDQELIRRRLPEMDVVITTALVPGRKAPTLVDRAMVESMKPGSIIVDLAAESGGNCELTKPGQTVRHSLVDIIGPVNLPSQLPIHASQLLSRNMMNLVNHITEKPDGDAEGEGDSGPRLALDFGDEIMDKTCIAHEGEIRDERTREALGKTRGEAN
ncbi:NAD/NADP transhydrogenase alpha subunit [Rubrobacter radiotolerans]|uniref:proton-translocating NAD(P)(+) transhydrogenase n=1 Tax=Rubrobacter radiotolerans TaxID=42256 RepID=A0A023X0M4_RUBRA|nr:NAD(P) transhydrogenase subunit alpha [Rubrobacter radiotolerans]AHY45584.1 NAD/NADP transhydrogenase alpha subunit [Rubrobacter radiotolerans]MDX5892998.1 NAD(P) transhydrogenase subunit alpha [Rubrobacter radiotolerans]SMC02876.1 NAD(P) transhydrogenase subunit alpha [Rubrobacter radiotolerans DSM 5868]